MSNAPWLDEAKKDLGLKEIVGKRHNPRVIEMFAESGHPWVKDDETAWCSAAANAWMKQAGYVGTGSLAARSWLTWGKSLNKQVQPGAVAVFKRGNSSWQGHVAFCTGKETRSHIEVLGGNQTNAVNTRMYPKSKLLDTRWPSTPGNSRTVKAALASIGGTTFGIIGESTQELVPLAQEASQWSQTMTYVAWGLGLAGALAALYFRLQDIREKGR